MGTMVPGFFNYFCVAFRVSLHKGVTLLKLKLASVLGVIIY